VDRLDLSTRLYKGKDILVRQMKIADHVQFIIDHMEAGKFDAALLHGCIALDATAKRLYPSWKVGRRYVQCIRDYYWLIEPMLGAGFNLAETRWGNVPLSRNPRPDSAEVVYEIFRCSHAHGDEVPPEFSVMHPTANNWHQWRIGNGELHMPSTVVWSLLAVAVLAHVNEREKVIQLPNYTFSLGEDEYLIDSWWGREEDFRPIADKANQVRVTMAGLSTSGWVADGPVGTIRIVQPGYRPKND
jgi:hypothetical protein